VTAGVFEQLLLAATALALVAVLGRAIPSLRTLPQRRTTLVLLGLLSAVLAIRYAVTTPTFIHANLHGAALTESILDFPRRSTARATYGQFSFLTLGLVAAIFGRVFEVVAATNQLLSVATLGLVAWLSARLQRSMAAALWVLAAGSFHVAVLRVGGSEDAHNLALFLGALALVAADLYAERQQLSSLAVMTLALVLMIHSRQTLYVWVPFAYLWIPARADRPWRMLLEPALSASAVVVAAALGLRIIGTVSSESERTSFIVMAIIVRTPGAVLALLRHHPLFDVLRFGPWLGLGALAGFVLAVRRRGTRVLALAFVASFIVSLPTGWHTPGVEFSFRMPALFLALVLAGLAGAKLFETYVRNRWLHLAMLSSVALTPCLLPTWQDLHRESADFQEYKHLRGQLAALPREVEVVQLSRRPSRPSVTPPVTLLRRAGIRARITEPGTPAHGVPRLLIPGIQCWGYGMAELVGFGDRSPNHVTTDELRRFMPVLFDGLLDGIDLPGERPECQTLLRNATPVGTPGQIVDAPQDIPFVLYGHQPIPLQLYLLGP